MSAVKITKLFDGWCRNENRQVGRHCLALLQEEDDGRAHALSRLEKIVPSHYEAPERLAHQIERFGWPKTAEMLKQTLPQTLRARSGELGEILGTSYVDECLPPFQVPIRRLRWKDGREMAMRGDDLIGIATEPGSGAMLFLKGECKSRQSLSTTVINEARVALDANQGLPTAHTLAFVSRCLFDLDRVAEADAIDDELVNGIQPSKVSHFIFALSGNEATTACEGHLQGCTTQVGQHLVSLVIEDHAEFIESIYQGVTRA